MTFEEVYKILYKKHKVARWDDVDKELKVRDVTTISTWELFALIDGLKETYAPKIKMPQKIMLVFMEMKFNYQVDFEFFWKLMGDCVATDYLRENYKEEEIMMAWLHPELIEVVDDQKTKFNQRIMAVRDTCLALPVRRCIAYVDTRDQQAET